MTGSRAMDASIIVCTYNRAASLVERMEQEGLVGAPNHVGKREILGPQVQRTTEE